MIDSKKITYMNNWESLKLPKNKARTAYLIRDAEEEKEYENEIFECGKVIIIFREAKEKTQDEKEKMTFQVYFKVTDGINALKDLEEHPYEELSSMEFDI